MSLFLFVVLHEDNSLLAHILHYYFLLMHVQHFSKVTPGNYVFSEPACILLLYYYTTVSNQRLLTGRECQPGSLDQDFSSTVMKKCASLAMTDGSPGGKINAHKMWMRWLRGGGGGARWNGLRSLSGLRPEGCCCPRVTFIEPTATAVVCLSSPGKGPYIEWSSHSFEINRNTDVRFAIIILPFLIL